jgi:hypothetical protein
MSLQKINFLIDSNNRQNNTEGTTDFTCSLNHPLRVRECTLKDCCIPLTFYNITTENNHFEFWVDTTSPVYHSFDVTVGHYTPASLLSVINDFLVTTDDAFLGSLRMSYANATGKFTFTFTPGSLGEPAFALSGSLLTWLGFLSPSVQNYEIQNQYPHGFLTDTNNYFKLNISYLDGGIRDVNNSGLGATFIVENTVDMNDGFYGKKLFVQNPNVDTGAKHHLFPEAITIQNFRISLRNSQNEVLNLNGAHWWAIVDFLVEDEKFPIIHQYPNPKTNTGGHLPLWMR